MAHVAKMTRAACRHMFKHYERAKDENGEYLKFGNQDIDPSRTSQNYNLAPDRETSQGDFVRQRCEEVGCLKRKDVNVMCSWIVTAPKSLTGTSHEHQFFVDTYNFLSSRYGKDNIVSAYVHMDEATPHMHFAFVPVVEDRKRGKLKVSAKECVNRKDLQSFHTDLDRHLHSTMGELYRGGILNGATQSGNKSIEELKRDSLKYEIEKLEQQKNTVLNDLKGANSAVRLVQDIESIPTKTRIGGKIEVSADGWNKVKDTAKAAGILGIEYGKLKERVKTLENKESIKISMLEGKVKILEGENKKLKHLVLHPELIKEHTQNIKHTHETGR